MSEGEFKKRLEEHRFLPSGSQSGREEEMIYASDFESWLDEAHRDIFSAITIEQGIEEGISTRHIYINDTTKLILAIMKWFEDKK